MSLQDQLTSDMKTAMKAQEKARLSTVRMLLAEVKNAVIAKRAELTEEEEIDLLATQAKRRRESIEAFDKGGRAELAAQERAELALIEGYLPAQLTADEVRALVRDVIGALGATTKADMGKVMGRVMPQLRGRFPGAEVKPIVEAELGG